MKCKRVRFKIPVNSPVSGWRMFQMLLCFIDTGSYDALKDCTEAYWNIKLLEWRN